MAKWKPLDVNTERRTDEFGEAPFGYVIRYAWEPPTGATHWVDFAIFHVIARLDDGTAVFALPDARVTPGDDTTNIDDAGPIVEGMVKWDGCTQFTFPDGVHVDSRNSLDELLAAIQEARRVASVEIIGKKQWQPEYEVG